MCHKNLPLTGFDEMNLSSSVFSVLQEVGYETPTPIQSMTIPHLLLGKDMLGQARTGTGKTAAFALPLLSRIDVNTHLPQVLVLTPTRELAIQVAESFKTYGAKMKGLNVLAVYGGQGYPVQLKQLKRGAHVIVGTPGRLMDHMQRKTLCLDNLGCVVLDEADEMLRMGFIEDVEWILDKTPAKAQTALFSATMPGPVRRIAQKYLTDPEESRDKGGASGVEAIDQQYWQVKGAKKTDALARILQAASSDGVIVFVKTKTATLEVAKALEDKGFKAEALNGDLAQTARERTVNRLKNSHIDILVATDVAARGLDVERISHVINYDMPSGSDPYIHRIGRTGRAGRTGQTILFVRKNEQRMLRVIEKATGQKIRQISLPSNKAVNEKRVADFKQSISSMLDSPELDDFKQIIESFAKEQERPVAEVAAAVAKMAHGDSPFFLPADKKENGAAGKKDAAKQGKKKAVPDAKAGKGIRPPEKNQSGKLNIRENKKENRSGRKTPAARLEKGMDRYRVEVGRNHGACPRDIVGAISNEAGLEGRQIGTIEMNGKFSFVDLPEGMPSEVFHLLKKTWVRSRRMAISKCA
ncbi:MAG: DEAD/DEAH box helicase [Desulfobacteraceae bacterium]